MNSLDLFLVGKKLMQLGEEALVQVAPPDHLATRAHLLLLADINDNPWTTISEAVQRTGLPQSQVSTLVGKLVEIGSLVTRSDPRDRRRTLVNINAEVSDRVAQVRSQPVGDVLRLASKSQTTAALAEVEAAIETLLRHLTDRR